MEEGKSESIWVGLREGAKGAMREGLFCYVPEKAPCWPAPALHGGPGDPPSEQNDSLSDRWHHSLIVSRKALRKKDEPER